MTRRDTLLTRGTDPNNQLGLEIGALNNPIVPPSLKRMKFVDYTDAAGLKAQHAAHPDRVANIVDVDYVWSGSGSLKNIVERELLFDFVIASHVIEHVPNTLGWFRGISEVMKPASVFNLAIPDKRYTFDINCPLSTLGELIEADMLNYAYPSVRQMFDHTFHILKIDPGEIWKKPIDISKIQKYNGKYAIYIAHEQAKKIVENRAYFDSHCWIYTPESFLELIEGACLLGRFDLLPLEIETTSAGEFEFFATFEKPSASVGTEDLKMKQFGMIQDLKKKIASHQHVSSLSARRL